MLAKTETIRTIDKSVQIRIPDHPTFWFDKDGVLAKYDYSIYMAETGCTPPWLTKNAHVYKNLPANKNMVKAFRRMYAKIQDNPPHLWDYELKILTTVSDSVTLSEQTIDSWKWLKKKIPGFKERDFYAVAVAKQEIPVILRKQITPMDILIDDYNKNLEAWKKAGGTAVKAINDINSINENYISLDIASNTADCIKDRLENLADLIRKEKDLSGMTVNYIENIMWQTRSAVLLPKKEGTLIP